MRGGKKGKDEYKGEKRGKMYECELKVKNKERKRQRREREG